MSRDETLDWEAILAAEGLPEELPLTPEVPRGDSLEVLDPAAARERAAQARKEESSDAIFGSPDAE